MPTWICEICSMGFSRHRSGERPIRFCSQTCYHKWRKDNNINTGTFVKGFIPWNKGLSVRLNPRTEFKKGRKSESRAELGEIRIRHDKNNKPRAWVKIGQPNKWGMRAVVEWENKYGPLPKGLIVHHVDRDTLNDSISNLSAISRGAHINEHRPELNKRRKCKATPGFAF